jgi:hypothetical protein
MSARPSCLREAGRRGVGRDDGPDALVHASREGREIGTAPGLTATDPLEIAPVGDRDLGLPEGKMARYIIDVGHLVDRRLH